MVCKREEKRSEWVKWLKLVMLTQNLDWQEMSESVQGTTGKEHRFRAICWIDWSGEKRGVWHPARRQLRQSETKTNRRLMSSHSSNREMKAKFGATEVKTAIRIWWRLGHRENNVYLKDGMRRIMKINFPYNYLWPFSIWKPMVTKNMGHKEGRW